MKDKKYFVMVYDLACAYLEHMKPTDVDLEKYYRPTKNYDSLNDVFYQFVYSAQNYQSMPKVIKFMDRKADISRILKGFDVAQVRKMEAESLYQTFRAEFKVTSADSKINCWYKWSRSIVDSAKFLSEFKDKKDFDNFVELFDYNVHTRMALPLLISDKICGVGFALACDILKELGYTQYPKPDAHLIDIFSELGLSSVPSKATEVFCDIVKMADYCNEMPYKIDKIFWLICSGRFYMEEPEIQIKGHKKEFIDFVKGEIDS